MQIQQVCTQRQKGSSLVPQWKVFPLRFTPSLDSGQKTVYRAVDPFIKEVTKRFLLHPSGNVIGNISQFNTFSYSHRRKSHTNTLLPYLTYLFLNTLSNDPLKIKILFLEKTICRPFGLTKTCPFIV